MVRVTKEKIDGVCGRIKENILEANKFLEGGKSEITEENVDKAMIMKLKLERTLKKLVEMIEELERQELTITTEDYDEYQYDAEDKLSELEVFIMNNKEKQKLIIEQKEKQLEIEQREKEKKMEVELREREKRMEMEMAIETEKIRMNEKIQLEKINLERLQIETDAKTQAEKIEAEVKLREIESTNSTKELEFEMAKVHKEVETIKSNKHTAGDDSTMPKSCRIRLPKLELKKFGGEILKWQEFWDTFEASIHKNSSLQPIDKFNYLRAQLEREALKAISGLELTNSNYDAAIAILKERYGNEQLIVDTHYTKLMEMSPAVNRTTSLRDTLDVIEQHLRSLQSLGEDVNQRQIISVIRTKLPKVVIARLEQQKDPDTQWTVESLRKSLKAYISAQEVAENQFLLSQQEQVTSKGHDYKGKQPIFKKPFGTTDALLMNEKFRSSKPRCIYCEKPHWSDECRTVSTLQARREKVKGKCYICLQSGHLKINCKVTKPYFHCKTAKSHHRSLCPSLFGTPEATPNNVFTSNVAEQEREPADNNETSMLSMNEQVIMQTALVEVMDPAETKSQVTRILMDTGSQRTYVTEEVARKLSVQPEGKEKLSIYTFGASKPKDIVTPVVTLVLKAKEGNTVLIKASVVPKISGEIQRKPVQLTNQFMIQRKYKLADTLPKTMESSTLGLLIGNDYYNDIMSSEKVKIEEGLYLMKSKFGWVISGRATKQTNERHQENVLFMMTRSSSNILPTMHNLTTVEPSLHAPPDIDEFWKLETIGIAPPGKIREDDGVMEHFKNTAVKVDGRYQVTWPWINEDVKPPENYELSLGRLKSLYQRLADNPDLLDKYDDIIKDQLSKNIIEEINGSQD